MYRNILIGGVTAVAIVGTGTVALAATGSNTTAGTDSAATSSTSSSTHAGHGKGKHGKGLLGRLEHGQFVTRGKGSTTITHDLIRGTVTSVSATSITVQAADKTSETFVVDKDTVVRVRENGKGAASSVSSVKSGDKVFVAGTGTSTLTAKHIVDVKGAKKK